MNSPPSSLATILQYSSEQGQQQPTTDEEGNAAILTYLNETSGQLGYDSKLGYDATHTEPEGEPAQVEVQVEQVEREVVAPVAAVEVEVPPLNNGAPVLPPPTEYSRLPPSRRSHNGVTGAQMGSAEPLPVHAPAPSSPIDTSVTIPETLASLPPPLDPRFVTPLSGLPAAGTEPFPVSLSDRGEMGGKRRKALHERAGWKEMEDGTERANKRARGDSASATASNGDNGQVMETDYSTVTIDDVAAAAAAASEALVAAAAAGDQQVDQQVDPQAAPVAIETPAETSVADDTVAAVAAVTAPEGATDPAAIPAPVAQADGTASPFEVDVSNMDAAMAVAAAVSAAASGSQQPAPAEEKTGRGRAKITKESRAEQNRKAQQIFRRRREEKIKQLEADSAALASTRTRLQVAEARIEQLALDLEARSIEAHALRTAMMTIANNAPVSVVTPQETLTITPAEFEGRNQSALDATQTSTALNALSRASRELAKKNRAQRLAEAEKQQAS